MPLRILTVPHVDGVPGVESPTAKLIQTSVQHQFSNVNISFSICPLSYANRHNKLISNGHLYRCLKFTFIFLEFILCRHQDDSSVQSLSCFQLFASPWAAARQASLSITNSQSLHKLMSIESVTPTNHLILCHPLLLPPSIFPSIMVFSNESALYIRRPNYWSFSFSISPSNEYLGLISIRMDCLDLLAVQGTLKSLLQHYSSKASILRHSAFFIAQLSHLYMTTEKTIALTRKWSKGDGKSER